jgi:hypothetical protein
LNLIEEINNQYHVIDLLWTGLKLLMGCIEHLTTRNYYNLAELLISNVAVSTAHVKYSQTATAVAW